MPTTSPPGTPPRRARSILQTLCSSRTGGKVVIQVKANGGVPLSSRCWEQLSIGGVDFARVSLSVVTDDLPRLNVLLLPYLYRDADHMWRVLDGSIGAEFLQGFTAQGRVA